MATAPFRIVASLFVANALLAAPPAWSQKLVQSALDSRVVLTYKANPGEVQRWVPGPWQSNPAASGPSKDANLMVVFVDRLLDQDGQGKPVATPSYRLVALVIPARNPQTGEAGPLVVRIYNSTQAGVPGFYKTAVLAAVERQFSSSGAGTNPGMVTDRWTMNDGKGGMLELQLQYQQGTPMRATVEAKPRSGMDPKIWRTYRIEQGVDVLKSMSTGVDRVKTFGFKTNVAELQKLFDGSEQLISVTALPWYTRQTTLPAD